MPEEWKNGVWTSLSPSGQFSKLGKKIKLKDILKLIDSKQDLFLNAFINF
jgi:hypothetical protein